MSTTEVTNDTKVFYAMRYDHRMGEYVWGHRVGIAEAIHRECLRIGDCPGWAPHQWLKGGFVDLELSNKHPYRHVTERALQ
jgi:hypothetical protein